MGKRKGCHGAILLGVCAEELGFRVEGVWFQRLEFRVQRFRFEGFGRCEGPWRLVGLNAPRNHRHSLMPCQVTVTTDAYWWCELALG